MPPPDPDEEPSKRPAALTPLDPLSIEELENYIASLEQEIGRARQAIEAKRKVRGGADALFRRST